MEFASVTPTAYPRVLSFMEVTAQRISNIRESKNGHERTSIVIRNEKDQISAIEEALKLRVGDRKGNLGEVVIALRL